MLILAKWFAEVRHASLPGTIEEPSAIGLELVDRGASWTFARALIIKVLNYALRIGNRRHK